MLLTRRFRRGFSFNTLYTWAKSIDNVSTYGGGRAVVAQNDMDLAAERGLSSFDRRHALSLNVSLASPFGSRSTRPGQGLTGRLLGDWTLTTSVDAHSSSPFTALVLGNRSDAGGSGVVGSARADATGLPIDARSGFFNTLAFQVPPPGQFGNASRNTIPGPAFFVVNTSLSRSFALGPERRRLEIRADAQNLLNTVNYTGLGTTVNAADYGLATNTGSMRSINLQMRLRF